MYSPVLLGDIIQRRSFTASGDVNPLSSKAKIFQNFDNRRWPAHLPRWGHHMDSQKLAGRHWRPPGYKVCHDLCAMGLSEASIEKFFAWLVQLARSRPNKMENFNQYFTAISWQLCMNLRQGTSFEEASNNIMSRPPTSSPSSWHVTSSRKCHPNHPTQAAARKERRERRVQVRTAKARIAGAAILTVALGPRLPPRPTTRRPMEILR